MDGEYTQVACYNNIDIIDKLANNNIHIGKSPASTTAITQPLNAGNCFLTAKSFMKGITYAGMREKYGNKIDNMEKLCKSHIQSNNGGKINYTHVKSAAYGLICSSLALQYGIKSTTIHNSFRITGIYPYNKEIILTNFKIKYSTGD